MMQRQFAEFKAAREGLLNAFPDIQLEVEDDAETKKVSTHEPR